MPPVFQVVNYNIRRTPTHHNSTKPHHKRSVPLLHFVPACVYESFGESKDTTAMTPNKSELRALSRRETLLTDLPDDVLWRVLSLLVKPQDNVTYRLLSNMQSVRQILWLRGTCSYLRTTVDKKYNASFGTVDLVKHSVPFKLHRAPAQTQVDTELYPTVLNLPPWIRQNTLKHIRVPHFISDAAFVRFIANLHSFKHLTSLSFHANRLSTPNWARPLKDCIALRSLKVFNPTFQLLTVLADPTVLPSLVHLSLLRLDEKLSGQLFSQTLPHRYCDQTLDQPTLLETLHVTLRVRHRNDDVQKNEHEDELDIENENEIEIKTNDNHSGIYVIMNNDGNQYHNQQQNINVPFPAFYEEVVELFMPQTGDAQARGWDSFIAGLRFISISHPGTNPVADRDSTARLRLKIEPLLVSGRLLPDACISIGTPNSTVKFGAPALMSAHMKCLDFVREPHVDEHEVFLYGGSLGHSELDHDLLSSCSCLHFQGIGPQYPGTIIPPATFVEKLRASPTKLRKLIWDGSHDRSSLQMVGYISKIAVAFSRSLDTVELQVPSESGIKTLCDGGVLFKVKHFAILLTSKLPLDRLISIIPAVSRAMIRLQSFTVIESPIVDWRQPLYDPHAQFDEGYGRRRSYTLEAAIRDLEARFPALDTDSLKRIMVQRRRIPSNP